MIKVAKEIHIIVVGHIESGKSSLINTFAGYVICPVSENSRSECETESQSESEKETLGETKKPFRVKLVRKNKMPSDVQAQIRFFSNGTKDDHAYVLPRDGPKAAKVIRDAARQSTDGGMLDDHALFAQLELRKAPNVILTDLPGWYPKAEHTTRHYKVAEFISSKYVETRFMRTCLVWVVSAKDILNGKCDFRREIELVKSWRKNPRLEVTGTVTHLTSLQQGEEINRFFDQLVLMQAEYKLNASDFRKYEINWKEEDKRDSDYLSQRLGNWIPSEHLTLDLLLNEPRSRPERKKRVMSVSQAASPSLSQPVPSPISLFSGAASSGSLISMPTCSEETSGAMSSGSASSAISMPTESASESTSSSSSSTVRDMPLFPLLPLPRN